MYTSKRTKGGEGRSRGEICFPLQLVSRAQETREEVTLRGHTSKRGGNIYQLPLSLSFPPLHAPLFDLNDPFFLVREKRRKGEREREKKFLI
jgi:hypothetical protein